MYVPVSASVDVGLDVIMSAGFELLLDCGGASLTLDSMDVKCAGNSGVSSEFAGMLVPAAEKVFDESPWNAPGTDEGAKENCCCAGAGEVATYEAAALDPTGLAQPPLTARFPKELSVVAGTPFWKLPAEYAEKLLLSSSGNSGILESSSLS